MKTAEGIGAWHNQYNTRPVAECVERALRAQFDFVIVKYGDPSVEDAYERAGIPWATERFVYVDQPENEAHLLADAVDAGACFAVINAEEGGGWGPKAGTGWAMTKLINTFRNRHPHVALYACLDTRGYRLTHPYQQVALGRCDGIMPMIYPAAFRPHQPLHYVELAFDDCLKHTDFQGKPIFPVLQSYPWEDPPGRSRHMGPLGIDEQARLAQPYPGRSFYTVHHATDAEWDAVCKLKPEPKPEPDPLIVAGKYITELALRVEGVKLAADGEWAALHAKLHEMKVEPA